MSHQISLSLIHHGFNSRLYLSAHSYISIRHISPLSSRQQHHYKLIYFKIHLVDNKFDKTIL
jgi:hypothetical protein